MIALLHHNAPDLFATVNPDGDAPAIVCCDHSGRHIPAALDHPGLGRAILDLHIAYDIGARQVGGGYAVSGGGRKKYG